MQGASSGKLVANSHWYQGSKVHSSVAATTMERWIRRYFLRKLRKVKKANGQILAVNEVCACTTVGRRTDKLAVAYHARLQE